MQHLGPLEAVRPHFVTGKRRKKTKTSVRMKFVSIIKTFIKNTLALIYQSCVKMGADLCAELWNIHIWPISACEWSGHDKRSGWIRSSLTCHVLKYSWFGGLAHWGQTWREKTLARRETCPRWRSASWQCRHIKGTRFTNAMLCKTEQARIIWHTFSWYTAFFRYMTTPQVGSTLVCVRCVTCINLTFSKWW